MKKILGIAAIVFLGAIPAHAQRAGSMGVSSVPNAAPSPGGGAIGGSSVGGSSTRLPIYPRATFSSTAIQGEDTFMPSSFMTFEQAVAEGIAESAPAKSLAQVAAESQAAMKAKSRVEFVQDHSGNVIPVAR
jgi:hypothetical protein